MIIGALILNLSLAISYIGLWIIQAQRGNLWRADFSAFYTGWAIVRDGKGSQIYNFELETQYQQNILGGRSFAEGLLPFNNPPHVALIFAPLAYLSLKNSYMVWTLIQIGLFAYLFWLLNKLSADWTSEERRMLLITAAALPSVLINFLLGAYSLLMLISLLQYTEALRRDRPIQVGLWFTIGMIKPQVMLLPGAILLAARRWRAFLACLFGTTGLFLISSMILDWKIWPDYLSQLRSTSNFFGSYGIDPRSMYNFRGTLALLMGTKHAAVINLISSLALIGSIIFIFWLWRGAWRPESHGFSLRMALTLILGSFFSLHANPQDGLFLIAPAVYFYNYLHRSNLPQRAYATFIVLCPLLFLISEFTIGSKLGIRFPVLAMIVLLMWITISLWKERIHGNR
jgi:hypothetical protein